MSGSLHFDGDQGTAARALPVSPGRVRLGETSTLTATLTVDTAPGASALVRHRTS